MIKLPNVESNVCICHAVIEFEPLYKRDQSIDRLVTCAPSWTSSVMTWEAGKLSAAMYVIEQQRRCWAELTVWFVWLGSRPFIDRFLGKFFDVNGDVKDQWRPQWRTRLLTESFYLPPCYRNRAVLYTQRSTAGNNGRDICCQNIGSELHFFSIQRSIRTSLTCA